MSETEITCRNCVAACCRNVVLDLTREEQKFMNRGGSNLVVIARPEQRKRDYVLYPRSHEIGESVVEMHYAEDSTFEPLEAGLGRFLLVGQCGYLETDSDGWQYCGAYDDRPGTCQDFEVGGYKCKLLRVLNDVDASSEEIPDLRDSLE